MCWGSQNRSGADGFTLVELMMTLVIVAVLAAIAMPSFKSILGDSALVTTTNDLVSSIHMARSESIKRGENVGVCPVVDAQAAEPVCGAGTVWTNGWLVFVDSNENGVRDAPGEVAVAVREARADAFVITPDALFANLVYFNSSGSSINTGAIPVSGNIRIDFGDEGARQISVSANGRVATQEVPL